MHAERLREMERDTQTPVLSGYKRRTPVVCVRPFSSRRRHYEACLSSACCESDYKDVSAALLIPSFVLSGDLHHLQFL